MRHIVAWIAIMGLAVGALGADDRKAEKARKEAFEDAKKGFTRLFKSEDPAVRKKAVLRLKDFADMGGARIMVDTVLPKERSPGVRDAAIGIIGSTKDPEEVNWLVAKATGRGNWRARAPLVEALGSFDTDNAKKAIKRLLEKEKDSRVLSMALFAVAEMELADEIGLVTPHLEHEDWQVRVAAIEALAAFKAEPGIEPLIDRLRNERGRLRQDIADALKEITGKDFGRDANRWWKWYVERGEGGGEDEPPAKPEPDQHPASTTDEPTYFGMKVVSDRVLFIFDVSLSMKTAIDIDKMKMAREASRTGGDEEEEDKDSEKFEQTIQWWKIKDRLDLAKAQLKFCIKNLNKKQQFEIVTFSEKVTSWNSGRLVKASTRAKLKAIEFIDSLDVEGATAAGAALEFCFEMAGPGAGDKNYKSGVDTVYFMSDGAPSDRNEDEILEEVRHRNRLRKVKIHVIAIVNHSVRFLRLLAKQNKGVYKFFQVEDKQ